MFGGSKSSTFEQRESTNVASVITSSGNIHIESGKTGFGDTVISGSKAKAEGKLEVIAEDDVVIASTTEEHYSKSEEKRDGMLTSGEELNETKEVTVAKSELEAKDDIVVQSKAKNITIKASRFASEGAIKIQAEKGHIAVLTEKETSYKHHMKSDMGFITWSMKDKGKYAETVVHSLFEAKGDVTFTAANGVTVEYRQTGNVKEDVAQLAKAPGLEWMGDLLERDDVDWRGVQETYDEWSNSSGGLSPGAMIIISIIVSAVTAGAASGLAAAMMGLQTVNGVVVGSTVQLAMHSALTAAFTSVAARLLSEWRTPLPEATWARILATLFRNQVLGSLPLP